MNRNRNKDADRNGGKSAGSMKTTSLSARDPLAYAAVLKALG